MSTRDEKLWLGYIRSGAGEKGEVEAGSEMPGEHSPSQIVTHALISERAGVSAMRTSCS